MKITYLNVSVEKCLTMLSPSLTNRECPEKPREEFFCSITESRLQSEFFEGTWCCKIGQCAGTPKCSHRMLLPVTQCSSAADYPELSAERERTCLDNT